MLNALYNQKKKRRNETRSAKNKWICEVEIIVKRYYGTVFHTVSIIQTFQMYTFLSTIHTFHSIYTVFGLLNGSTNHKLALKN